MPVRSSVCTYSPAAASAKYSAASLPAAHYKPLASARPTYGTYGSATGGAYGSSSAAGARSLSSRYNQSAYSPTSSLASYSSLGSTHSSSSSSYSPSSSLSSGSSGGLYRPLSSSAQSSFSSSSSRHHHHQTPPSYSRYSSASNSSASSLASLSTATTTTTGYSSSYNQAASYLQPPPSSLAAAPRRRLSSSYQTPAAAAADSPLPSGVPRGLVNLGNTCYMNAVLQALYSLEPFRQLLLRQHNGSDRPLTLELADLFKTMRGSTSAPVSPSNFKHAFARHQAKFAGLGQQDAQEFLRYLINGLHEEMNQAARRPRRSTPARPPNSAQEAWQQYRDIVDDSPLVDLLVGQMCSTIVCSVCQSKSHCWDPFWDLSLPLARNRHSAVRLAEVLQDFIAKETLDGDERPVCSNCKRPTRSSKQIELSRLPPVLILHLKKFTNDGYKLTSPEVRIDQQLSLGPSSSSPSANLYQLAASISHHGHSASSGHYTGHSRYSSSWFHFNDDRVKDVTGSFDSAKLNDAYVLFYTQSPVNQSKL